MNKKGDSFTKQITIEVDVNYILEKSYGSRDEPELNDINFTLNDITTGERLKWLENYIRNTNDEEKIEDEIVEYEREQADGL